MITHDQLIAYVSGALAPEERVRLEEQLAGDEASLRSVLEQERLDAALRVMFGAAAEREQVRLAILEVVSGSSYEDVKSSVLHDVTSAPRAARAAFFDWLAGWRGVLAGGLAAAACAALALLLWPRTETASPIQFAQLDDVRAAVVVARDGGDLAAKDGTALQPGDTVRVGDGASATVLFADRTRLALAGPSELKLGDDGKQFELALGQVVARVAKQPPGKPLRIRTPHATATVVGTEFDLRVSTRGTRLDVSDGLVQLAYVGGGGPMLVAAGDFVEIAPGAKTPVPYGDQPRDQNALLSSLDVPTLSDVTVGVSVIRNGESQPVADDFTPQPGDLLRVGAQAAAVAVYPDKSRLELISGTRLSFHGRPEEGKQLGLELGTVIGRVSKQPPDKPLRIRTPHATVIVVGTVFDLRVSTRGTRLDVIEGSAQIAWDGEEHSTTINAGEFIELELLSNKTLTIHRRGSTAQPPLVPRTGGPEQ